MAIDLATLLQSVPGLAEAPAPPQGWEKLIDPVALVPAQGPQVTPEPTNVSSVSQDIQGAEELGAKGLDKIQHKGIFGVKGTLRDILGILGDSLTGNMAYSKARRSEKYGDILAGKYQDNAEENFMNNPLLAIQRLGEEGFGAEAAELAQQHYKNEQAKQAALLNEARLARQENRDDVMAAEGEVRRQKGIQDIAARTYGGIQDEDTLRQFNERFAPILEKNGLGHIPLPRNLQEAKGWGIDTYRSNVLEDKDQDRGQRGEIADQRVGATIRGQNMSAETSRRGQDIRSEDTRRGQDMRGKGKKPNSPIGSLPSMIPPAPRRANDRITGPGGIRLVSPDGKRWVKAD